MDNACGAIARLIVTSPQHVPLEQVEIAKKEDLI
jgi:hypothetical protein